MGRPDREATISFLTKAWAVLMTVSTLTLGWLSYFDDASLARIEGRDRLDDFMRQVRADLPKFCVSDTELKPHYRDVVADLVSAARVSPQEAPYAQPCRGYGIEPPGQGRLEILIARFDIAPHPVRYETWDNFSNAKARPAVFWIENIPIAINITSANEGQFLQHMKKSFDDMKANLEDCTRSLRADPKYTFDDDVKCQYRLNDGRPELTTNQVQVSEVTPDDDLAGEGQR